MSHAAVVSRLTIVSTCLGWALFLQSGIARAIENTIVYIECSVPGGETSRGTGVLVSPRGHVLTAQHVVIAGSTCRGSVGVADPNTAALLVTQATNVPVDAALLRFSNQAVYEFARFCTLEDWMVRRRIFVAGFPGDTKTGVPSYREGILSTVFPNAYGILESDGQTVAGMSGGPVYSNNLAGLVGIVIGANIAVDGTVSYYGIPPVSYYAEAFDLMSAESPCYHKSREVDFSDADGDSTATWKAGDDPVPLGIHQDVGSCFIESVWGQWNDPNDKEGVLLQEGEYVLRGENHSGGEHGASAKCILYE